MKHYKDDEAFELENGGVLNELNIAYHTYGQMNSDKSNVVWICHHLTANSDVSLWWTGMIGPGAIIDPARHFIVCAGEDYGIATGTVFRSQQLRFKTAYFRDKRNFR